MLDPEAIVVKGGIIIMALLTILRLVVHDILNIGDDLARRRRRQR